MSRRLLFSALFQRSDARRDGARLPLYAERSLRAALGAAISSVFFLGISISPLEPARADEDWERFLQALDDRGYDDVALDYLRLLEKSGNAPPELAAELDFRLGVATLKSLSTAPASARADLAAQGRASLERYLAANPDSANAAAANAALAQTLIDAGERSLADAGKKGVSEDAKSKALLAARVAFADAKKPLDAALQAARTRVQAVQKDPKAKQTDKQDARAEFVDLTLRVAKLTAQTARTFPEGAAERTDGLTKARGYFAKFYETYHQFPAAFEARFNEAQVAAELGEVDAALGALSELAVLPYEDRYSSLKTRASLLEAEIALAGDDPARWMSVLQKFNAWKDAKLDDAFYGSAEGLRFHLLTARATIKLEELRRSDRDAFVAAGRKTFVDANDPTYKLLNSPKKTTGSNAVVVFALETLSFVASGRGSAALEAEELLKHPLFEGIDRSKFSFAQKVSDFASAADAASRAASIFAQTRADARNAAPELAAEANAQAEKAAADAYQAFQTAFGYVDDKTPNAELDALKLRFAVLCFSTERFDDAFAAANELVKNRPDFADAPQAATVALRALQASNAKLRSEAADDETLNAASAKLAEYAAYVVERWNAATDAASVAVVQEAALVRTDAAVASGDLDGARALLEQIPEDSPRRAVAELRLGSLLWKTWNERKVAADAQAEIADAANPTAAAEAEAADAALAELRDAAEKTLLAGLQRKIAESNRSKTDYLAIYSAFQLAEIYERAGNVADAEKWLTHPDFGPLAVVEAALDAAAPVASENGETSDANAENAATSAESTADAANFLDDDFQTATLALALRVRTADASRLDEAQKTMERLEAVAARNPENASKLTSVYVRLGRRIEERLVELKEAADDGDASKAEELAATTKSFEAFLQRVAQRGDANGYAALRWVADSYLSLGRGLAGTLGDPPPEAVAYFAEAGRAYQTISRRIAADPNFAPTANARFVVSTKIVECLRGAGAYEKAFSQLGKLLDERPTNVELQFEAARTLAAAGRKNPTYFAQAIVGGLPNAQGRSRAWGWNGLVNKLARASATNPRLAPAFYDACFEKTRCRYLDARRTTDPAEREKKVRDAETELERLRQVRPDLGGAATFAKFDAAYQNFQKLRGVKKPKSLRAVGKPVAAATATPKPTPPTVEKPIENAPTHADETPVENASPQTDETPADAASVETPAENAPTQADETPVENASETPETND
ncbi:MAG: hypothetical protein J6K25_06860 [Thermoguttaceae bacterium]|nr:hypothetical protein [Thermoguttaceae bacterium]